MGTKHIFRIGGLFMVGLMTTGCSCFDLGIGSRSNGGTSGKIAASAPDKQVSTSWNTRSTGQTDASESKTTSASANRSRPMSNSSKPSGMMDPIPEPQPPASPASYDEPVIDADSPKESQP